ncbi:MAG: hypothetical protein IRY87_29180 [Acetobacteraceae bacterium]|nr:hypothetical protein [Acetobacteraceae bacterium]
MVDAVALHDDPVTASARKIAVVTPDDANDLPRVTKALWVTATGTLSIIAVDDSAAVSLGTVPAGTLIPVRARRVMATGTTATVVALY